MKFSLKDKLVKPVKDVATLAWLAITISLLALVVAFGGMSHAR